MSPDPAAWINHRAHLAAAGVANAAAWITSMDTGTLITGLTAIVGLGAYGIKTIGNAITEVRVNRDKLMAGTVSDQMDRLSRNLEDAQKQHDASEQLVATLRSTLAVADRRNAELTASMADISDQVGKARESLHALRNESQTNQLRAVAAERELKDIREKFGHLPDVVAENAGRIDQVTARMDAASVALHNPPG